MIATNEGYSRSILPGLQQWQQKERILDIKNHFIYTDQKPTSCSLGLHHPLLGVRNIILICRGSWSHQGNRRILITEYLKRRFYADALQLKTQVLHIMGIGINDSIELEGDYWRRLELHPMRRSYSRPEKYKWYIRQTENTIPLWSHLLLPIHTPILLKWSGPEKDINKEMNAWLAMTARRKKLIWGLLSPTTTFPNGTSCWGHYLWRPASQRKRASEIMAAVWRIRCINTRSICNITQGRISGESTMILILSGIRKTTGAWTLYTVPCHLEACTGREFLIQHWWSLNMYLFHNLLSHIKNRRRHASMKHTKAL